MALLLQGHLLLVLLVVLAFGRLQIEPRIAEGFDVRQEGFDKWMELILDDDIEEEMGRVSGGDYTSSWEGRISFCSRAGKEQK